MNERFIYIYYNILNIGVDIMEIKYKNTVEDVEFLLSYYSSNFLKNYFYPLYVISIIIPFFSGIYYSYRRNNILYFFTNSVVMTIMAPYILIKLEPKFRKNIIKRQTIKLFNSEKYFSTEKYLSIDNNLIIVKYDNTSLEIKLNKDIAFDVLEEYILIIVKKELGYKKKLIIPNKVFNSEEEKIKFIEKIKSKITI
jgi:hypothetical protein